MIYHLTNFQAKELDPQDDLIEAIVFLYTLLAPGGTLYLVYADLEEVDGELAACSLAEKYFRKKYPKEAHADQIQAIYRARNALLGPNGSIVDVLSKRFPAATPPEFHAIRQQTYFFGESIADIAVLSLAGELCPSNREKFEIDKLQFCFEYIIENPESIGLTKEQRDVPQKGLWRANEPQVIATISKQK